MILFLSLLFSYYYLLPSSPHSGSAGKESACNAGDQGLIPGSGRWEWQPTPVFLLGEFHGQRSLVGCNNPWGHKKLDINEQQTFSLSCTYPPLAPSTLHHTHSTLNGLSENSAPRKSPVLCLWGPLEANTLFLRSCSFLLSPAAAASPSCCQKHVTEPSQASPAPPPLHPSQPLPPRPPPRS